METTKQLRDTTTKEQALDDGSSTLKLSNEERVNQQRLRAPRTANSVTKLIDTSLKNPSNSGDRLTEDLIALGPTANRSLMQAYLNASKIKDYGQQMAVKEAIIEALYISKDQHARRFVYERMEGGSFEDRSAACRILAYYSDPRALKTIITEVTRPIPSTHMISLLGHYREPEALKLLLKFFQDKELRSEALRGLREYGLLDERVRPVLTALFSRLRDNEVIRALLPLTNDRKSFALLMDRFKEYADSLPAGEKQKTLKYISNLELSYSKYGFRNGLRYSPETLSTIIEERERVGVDPKPIAIVVTPREDGNGAFSTLEKPITQLRNAGYRVLVFEVGNEDEAVHALRLGTALGTENFKPASLIMFNGHGARTSIQYGPHKLGNRATLDINDRLLETPWVGQTLATNGYVVLSSCDTGEGQNTKPNVANRMREIFPHAAEDGVFAPVTRSNDDEMSFFLSEGEGPYLISVDFGRNVGVYQR